MLHFMLVVELPNPHGEETLETPDTIVRDLIGHIGSYGISCYDAHTDNPLCFDAAASIQSPQLANAEYSAYVLCGAGANSKTPTARFVDSCGVGPPLTFRSTGLKLAIPS